jgi:hypothetical protein
LGKQAPRRGACACRGGGPVRPAACCFLSDFSLAPQMVAGAAHQLAPSK